METNVNFTTVGAIVLGLLAFFIVFLIWLGGVGFQSKPKQFEVLF